MHKGSYALTLDDPQYSQEIKKAKTYSRKVITYPSAKVRIQHTLTILLHTFGVY
jgi:hypothetical protein